MGVAPSFEWIFADNPLEGLHFKSSQKLLLSSTCALLEVSLALVLSYDLEVGLLSFGDDYLLGANGCSPRASSEFLKIIHSKVFVSSCFSEIILFFCRMP
jgi:hypothetical protein